MKDSLKIVVTGGKGGVGKSMVAASLAVESAATEKTILVDADAECPNDHLFLSARRKKYATVYQPIPKWSLDKCLKCGQCANICKQNAIVFAKNKYPAFIKDMCIGCRACIASCPVGAISESKKEIGKIYTGENYKVSLVSSELKLGELASGEVVAKVRKYADQINQETKSRVMIIDSAAGIGCPVIASLTGTDYIIAVTEPTPAALSDLKRVLYLANHFRIKHGIIINKFDLDKSLCIKIEKFARKNKINIIGKIPYREEILKATIKMKPIVITNQKYRKVFRKIIKEIIH